MGKRAALALLLLLGLSSARSAFGGQVTLAWDPNAEPDLAGYRLHYGLSSGEYTTTVDVGSATTQTVGGLADGQTHYFAATAYDSAGRESGYSNEISYTPPVPAVDAVPAGPDQTESVPAAAPVVSAGFEGAGELGGWDDGGSGARLELSVGERFEGSSSLRISGGAFQGARGTFTGLTAGQRVVVRGAVKVVGASSPVSVVLGGAGAGESTQAEFSSNGTWQYFAVPRTVTSEDEAGLEVSVAVQSPTATVYLDSLAVGEELYRSDLSTRAGWGNGVYQVLGGAVLRTVWGGVDGGAALKVSGGTSQAARFTVQGLPVGATVSFSGWVSTGSAEPVSVRMHGSSKTDWTQASVAAGGGAWFSLTKTITEQEAGGLDLDVILRDPAAELLLDEVALELGSGQ